MLCVCVCARARVRACVCVCVCACVVCCLWSIVELLCRGSRRGRRVSSFLLPRAPFDFDRVSARGDMPLSTRSVAATNSSSTARTTSRSTKTTALASTTGSTATPKTAAPKTAAQPKTAATAASCSTAAATSSSGEPSRIQVLREARKAAAERERGCEALVEAANLRRDPLKELSVPRTFQSNGLDAALEWHRGAALSDDALLFCAALLAANMRAQAKAAGWGSMGRVSAPARPPCLLRTRLACGSWQLGAPSRCLGCSSQPPQKPPIRPRSTIQVGLERRGQEARAEGEPEPRAAGALARPRA